MDITFRVCCIFRIDIYSEITTEKSALFVIKVEWNNIIKIAINENFFNIFFTAFVIFYFYCHFAILMLESKRGDIQ